MSASITAAMLYDMVTCPHRLTMDQHAPAEQRDPVSPFVALLWRRGATHEAETLAGLGLAPLDVGGDDPGARERATLEAMDSGVPLIAGGRIRHDDLLGEPDLLRLEDDGYVAGDIKSGSGDEGPESARKPKRSYAMQLALYTDILENQDRSAGRYGFILDGHGDEVSYELDAPRGPRATVTLWQDYQRMLAQARAIVASPDRTRPAYSSACKQCVWRSACTARLEAEDDLSLLPEVGRTTRDVLMSVYPTVQSLAEADPDELQDQARRLEGVGATMLRRLHDRARLARDPAAAPFLRAELELPEASLEVFFDVEVDPLRDHCYLHGFLERRRGGSARYRHFFAANHTEEAEEHAFTAAWTYLTRLRDAAIYHYGVYERTVWRDLQERFPQVCDAEEVEELFASEEVVDLYTAVIRPRSEWPTRDYSIKSIARHLGFQWRDEDPSGASCIEWYERWLEEGDQRLKSRILAYNEDDCRATAAVLDGVRALDVREPD